MTPPGLAKKKIKMSQYSAQEHLESLKKFKIKEIEKNTFILVVGYTGSSVGVTSTIANTSTTANTIANTTTNTYEIYLILTENFPSQKPTLLLPSYSHSLIKDNEIQFNYNTLLGEIFTEIETKFRVETPILKSIDLVDYHKVKELLKDNELSSLLHSTPEIRRASFVKEKVLESNASQAGNLY